MKIKPIIKISSVLLFLSIAINSNLKGAIPVELSVYDGQGGLLIDWQFDKDLTIEKVILSSKKFGETSFKILEEFNVNTGRYLDCFCEKNERYYYKIEIIDKKGRMFTSDLSRPPFGNCVEAENSILNIKDFKTLKSSITFDLLNIHNISTGDLTMSYLHDLIQIDSVKGISEWIDNFPPNLLKIGGDIVDKINLTIEGDFFKNKSSYYERLFRNKMLITPAEWEKEYSDVAIKLKQVLNDLSKSNLSAIDYINEVEPVRVTAIYNEDYNRRVLNLHFFHPEIFTHKELLLLYNDEYIDVDVSKVSDVRNQTIIIPQYWNTVKLMMDDSLLNKYHILKDKNIMYCLNNDIVPLSDGKETQIRYMKEESGIWLNEIRWNNMRKTLDLEIAKKNLPIHQHVILSSSKIIWQIDTESLFEQNFVDSTFVIDVKNIKQNRISISRLEGGEFKDLEYIILEDNSFLKARDKDFKWTDITYNTFGDENSINNSNYDASLLPEIFVLYQNYPNPFNGQTKISFDLINPAVVSLFISDAKGRIHESFLYKENISPGAHSFIWNGENKSTGIYFVTLQAQVEQMPPAIYSRKMIYLK